MKISMRFITALVFALSLAATAMAQTASTGSISGTVVDQNQAAVPGVTVRVTSPNLISPQTATTDDSGRFTILNLPPGRYMVTAEAAGKGFGKFEKANIEVNLSSTSTVDIEMRPEAVGGVVTVTGTSGAAVDVSNNTTGTNVSTEQFSNFPTQRTVQSLYTIAPTATRSGLRDAAGRERDPSVGGASGPENNYILDGVTTSDPAYGGGGANLPFEFVQEVEIKTGAFGAEYGKSTGGIFNVITKSGGNEFRGDVFGYFTSKGMVAETKNFSNSTASFNGYSEIDAGFDIGGPIIRDRVWFFGAFNPQRRENFYLGQSLRTPFQNKVTTPFYAGKLTFGLNSNNTLTLSTFGDFTKIEGFQVSGTGSIGGSFNGFGADPNSFLGTNKTGGHNYAARLNSTITPNWIGEFSFGMHFQRFDREATGDFGNLPSTFDNFSILTSSGAVAPLVNTSIYIDPAIASGNGTTGLISYIYGGSGASLQRTYFRSGFASIFEGSEDRNRWELAARLQNIWGQHTFKYGFEYVRNIYDIDNRSTGPSRTWGNPAGLTIGSGATLTANGYRVDHRFLICTVRTTTIVCPSASSLARAQLLVGQNVAGVGVITAATSGSLTLAETTTNPFLILNQTRIRDFRLQSTTHTNTQSFYFQDDFKLSRDVTFLGGLRWDYQQGYGKPGEGQPLKLNDFTDNMQPRVGLIWDFTGRGAGKMFINYARFVETPLPLDVNVRALSDTAQTDLQWRVDRYGAPAGSNLVRGLGGNTGAVNLGHAHTPPDPDLKPQTLNEVTAGIDYEIVKDLALGFRGIYRAQGSVIEDGATDEVNFNYFLFNPGESQTARDADAAGVHYGRARRYYRALELTATKRFSNNYQFIASYVFSSLTGNYEGLFRNDNGQADPNITSLFDLPSLLQNLYGRLPNDRPHQLKFDGSWQSPWRFLISGAFRAQSGNPFDALGAHPIYGNNEGFVVPRGTAIIPANAPGGIKSGDNRSPTTYQVDLGGYLPIKFGENRQLRFTADLFNVFDSQRATFMDKTFVLGSGQAGVPDTPNPFWGTGTNFQYPRTLRLGAKFQF